ncbi:MAG: hypothetical protein KDA75_09195, partial [Planctomycetaceae bacterium]|nr:hypothetical protein [Planctomycetaceae bacterium]
LSFIGLILVGTGLLLLPGSQTERLAEQSFLDRLRVALFTATSASCVTGLAVVPTGGSQACWSRFGQVVIMLLFQIGGLGIMTIGTVFSLLIRKHLAVRESLAVAEVTEAMTIRDVRHLLLSILGFTLSFEAIGAVLLSTLWNDEPLAERLFLGAFHSISAFCNAGFALTENSFTGMATMWQIWAVVCPLIVIGGFGFGTMTGLLKAMWHTLRDEREAGSLFRKRRLSERLPLSARIIVTTTVVLLISGTIVYGILETVGPHGDAPFTARIADAWFQSVTFRTAGFNTVDLGGLQPSSKLIAILLMFIGASPGSTGGGVKTVVFAVSLLGVSALLNGRPYLECRGRMIPSELLNRAVGILLLAGTTVIVATLLICLFEQHPERFLDHLFEATSAAGTVGVSTGLRLPDGTVQSTTQSLSMPSRFVVIVAMFLGRVGPLTLLLALTGKQSTARYEYPTDRVTLT